MLAQAKYYQELGAGTSEFWSEILHGPASEAPAVLPDTVDSPDNLSLASCPPPGASEIPGSPGLASFEPHHKRTQSACLPVRPPRSHRPLSHQPAPSPTSYNMTLLCARPLSTPPPHPPYSPASSRISLASSQPSLVPQSPPVPRPASLYVPFVGRVDAPRAPPGRAARDILNAMSFAPTHDSFSSQDDNHSPAVPQRSRLFKSPKLRSKSSSLASIISTVSPKMSRKHEADLSSSMSSLGPFHSPSFSPSHPNNNCENSCLKVTHPPVIHPPPDLVLASTPGLAASAYSPQISRTPMTQSPLMFEFQNPSQLSSLAMIRESSPYQSS